MVGVMVMTPVHMGHAGGGEDAVLRVVGLVISVHVAGMYLFSPLVGALADRVGAPTVVALGGVAAAGRHGRGRDRRSVGRRAARGRAAAPRAGVVLRPDRRLRPW